jgi:hypothetical protein
MDPCIESQLWEDFHHAVIEVIREALIPQTWPRHVVRVEERVYVEHVPHSDLALIRPDVTVLERTAHREAPERAAATAAPVAIAPVILHVPRLERVREAFLTIRERETSVGTEAISRRPCMTCSSAMGLSCSRKSAGT